VTSRGRLVLRPAPDEIPRMKNTKVDRTRTRGARIGTRARGWLLVGLAALGACMDDTPTGQGPSSHLRFVQAVPNAPAVDVLVDETPVMAGLGYRAVSGFTRVEAGIRRIQVRASGTSTMLLDFPLGIEFPRAYTVVSTGMLGGVESLIAPDTASIPNVGEMKLRIIHAAPSTGLVDVYVTDPNASLTGATPVFEDVPFRGNTEYLALPAGSIRVRITTAGTTTTLVDMTQLFNERVMRTVVAADAPGGGLPLNGLLLVDF
jgi:Domain of unknown function (DUF4397)